MSGGVHALQSTENYQGYKVLDQTEHSVKVQQGKDPLAQYGSCYLQTYPQDSANRSQQVIQRLDEPVPRTRGVFAGLPPQNALDAFQQSLNCAAFRECGLRSDSSVHPNSIAMQEVYDQLGHQLGTNRGMDYFWDASIYTCSHNSQKIKAIETIYVERAQIELQQLATDFRSGDSALRVHRRCRTFFTACKNIEILQHVPDRVFIAVWERERPPKKNSLSPLSKGKELFFSTQLNCRESCALALESAMEVCHIRTDGEYRELVDPPLPAEVLFARAISLYRKSMPRKANEQIRLLKDTSEEAGKCLTEATKKYKPWSRWESLRCDQKRYVAEAALLLFAVKQLKDIAQEFRANHENVAHILSHRLFYSASNVPLLQNIEGEIYCAFDERMGEEGFWQEGNNPEFNIARAEAIDKVVSGGMPKLTFPKVIYYSYANDSEENPTATTTTSSRGTKRSFDQTVAYFSLGFDAFESVRLAITVGPEAALPVIATRIASKVATTLCMQGASSIARTFGYGREFSQLASSFKLVCCTTQIASLSDRRFGDEPETLPTPYDPPWHPGPDPDPNDY